MAVVVATSVFLLIAGTGAIYQYYKLRDTMEWGSASRSTNSLSRRGVSESPRHPREHVQLFRPRGFLEWQLHPGKLTFIDGRGAAWPNFSEHQIVTSGMNDTENVFSKYNITYIVTKAADSSGMVLPLVNYLAARPEWELVFADGLSLVFMKTSRKTGTSWRNTGSRRASSATTS